MSSYAELVALRMQWDSHNSNIKRLNYKLFELTNFRHIYIPYIIILFELEEKHNATEHELNKFVDQLLEWLGH